VINFLNPTPVLTTPEDMETHDNTMFTWFDECARLYQVFAVLGLRPKLKRAPLEFGSLLHEGLDTLYQTKSIHDAVNKMESLPYEDPIDDHRTKARAILTLVEYHEHYGDEEGWFKNILLTETPFDIVSLNGFRYGGKIDLIVNYNDEAWIIDHKTTSMGGPTWWDQFYNSPQMLGYVFAGSLLVGRPIQGVIVNQLLIHKTKKSPEEQFARRPFLYSKDQVEEWLHMRASTYQKIKAAKDSGYFPPNYNNCKGKFGRCALFNICTLPQASRARALEYDFEHNPWDWRHAENE